MTNIKKLKIGIFDSGLGGLSVYKSLCKSFRKQISIVYLGDLAHLPYGEKSTQSIIRYSDKICTFLLEKKVDIIIIACNSASSVASKYLISKYYQKVPIIETINPSVRQVYSNIKIIKDNSYSVGIIGTETTVQSQAYDNALQSYNKHTKINLKIESIACPLFVPLVEEGWENTEIAHQIATKYLSQFKNKLDTIILACTHYPILFKTLDFVFQKLGNKNLQFINSGDAIAQELYSNNNLFKIVPKLELERNKSIYIEPNDEFYVTDTPYHFHDLANKFLGYKINNIELIAL